jgi:hypothetical protein
MWTRGSLVKKSRGSSAQDASPSRPSFVVVMCDLVTRPFDDNGLPAVAALPCVAVDKMNDSKILNKKNIEK